MKIAQLETFVVVAEELHFRRAAERLFTQPSTVSTQIAQLEAEYGTPLFIRNSRNVSLSPAGEVLLEKARITLASVDDLTRTARLLSADGGVALTVGAMDEGIGELATVVDKAYRSRFEKAQLSVEVLAYSSLRQSLVDGVVDVGIVDQADGVFSEAEAQVFPLIAESRIAAFAPDHRLAAMDSIEVDQLLDEPFLVVPGLPDALRNAFTLADRRDLARSPDVVIAASHTHGLLNVIAQGRATALFTAANERFFQRPDIVYVPVVDLDPIVTSIVVRRGELRPHVLAYVEECVRAVRSSLGLIPAAVDVTGDVDVSVLAAGSGGLG